MIKKDQLSKIKVLMIIIMLIFIGTRMVQNIRLLEEASNLIAEIEQSKGYSLNQENVAINANEIATYYSNQEYKGARLYFLSLFFIIPIIIAIALGSYCTVLLKGKRMLRWIPVSAMTMLSIVILSYGDTLSLLGHALE